MKFEYTEIINGANELLLLASGQFFGSILRGGRCSFRNEHVCGGRNSVMFTQRRLRGYQGWRR